MSFTMPRLANMAGAFFKHISWGSIAILEVLRRALAWLLHPCQWMLLEAKQCRLSLDFGAQARDNASPLLTLFPKLKLKENNDPVNLEFWSCSTENGIIVTMQDLRDLHQDPRFQQKTFAIKLASPKLRFIR
jgi:hypothetical protein